VKIGDLFSKCTIVLVKQENSNSFKA